MRNRYHPIILAENCYLPPSKSCLFVSSAKINHFSEISNKKPSFLIGFIQNLLFSVFVPPECV